MWMITEQFCEDPRSIRCRSLDFSEGLRDRLQYPFRFCAATAKSAIRGSWTATRSDQKPGQRKTRQTTRSSILDGPDMDAAACSSLITGNGLISNFSANGVMRAQSVLRYGCRRKAIMA